MRMQSTTIFLHACSLIGSGDKFPLGSFEGGSREEDHSTVTPDVKERDEG